MTRDAVQGSLMASSVLSFQNILLNLVTRLRLAGPLLELLGGASLTEGTILLVAISYF